MEHRTFHGEITPDDLGRVLVAEFNRGNMRAQQIGQGSRATVQIASREGLASGGKTGVSVAIEGVEDGVTVSLGQQEWLGTAASRPKPLAACSTPCRYWAAWTTWPGYFGAEPDRANLGDEKCPPLARPKISAPALAALRHGQRGRRASVACRAGAPLGDGDHGLPSAATSWKPVPSLLELRTA
jgi:hypothetical protein